MKQIISVTPYGKLTVFLKELVDDFAVSNLGEKGTLTIKHLVEMIDRTGKGYSVKDINTKIGMVSILHRGKLKLEVEFTVLKEEIKIVSAKQRDLEQQINEEKLRHDITGIFNASKK